MHRQRSSYAAQPEVQASSSGRAEPAVACSAGASQRTAVLGPPPGSLQAAWELGYTARLLVEIKKSMRADDEQYLQPLAAAIELLKLQNACHKVTPVNAFVWVLLTDMATWRFFCVHRVGDVYNLYRWPTLTAKLTFCDGAGVHPKDEVVQVGGHTWGRACAWVHGSAGGRLGSGHILSMHFGSWNGFGDVCGSWP